MKRKEAKSKGEKERYTHLNAVFQRARRDKKGFLRDQCKEIEENNRMGHLPAIRRYKIPGFDPWVRKTPWRQKWHFTPVFLPGKFQDRGVWWATVHGVVKS